MSEADRSQFKFLTETAIGVTPSAALQEVLVSSAKMGQNPQTRVSTTIRSDGQVQDNIREDIAPGAEININASYKAVDPFWESLLQSSFSSKLAYSGTIGVDGSLNNFTSNSTSAGPDFTTAVVGQWIKSSGFTNPANNGFFKITAKSTGTPTAELLTVTGGTLVTESAATARKINGCFVMNGVTSGTGKLSKSMEIGYLDHSPVDYDSLIGACAQSMEQTARAGQAITLNTSFLAMKAGLTGSATIGNGTVTAAPQNQEMNANDHIPIIYYNGLATTLHVNEFVLSPKRALRAKKQIGTLGAWDIGIGRFTCEGTFNCYFEDRTILDLARTFTKVGLAYKMRDDAGNAYIFDIPTVRITDGDPDVTGVDTDVFSPFKFMAQIDSVTGKMFSISRFDAAD